MAYTLSKYITESMGIKTEIYPVKALRMIVDGEGFYYS